MRKSAESECEEFRRCDGRVEMRGLKRKDFEAARDIFRGASEIPNFCRYSCETLARAGAKIRLAQF